MKGVLVESVDALIKYLGQHPLVVVGGIVALVVIYYLLQRKPKLVRDAEEHFEGLRKKRGDHYNKTRPLK